MVYGKISGPDSMTETVQILYLSSLDQNLYEFCTNRKNFNSNLYAICPPLIMTHSLSIFTFDSLKYIDNISCSQWRPFLSRSKVGHRFHHQKAFLQLSLLESYQVHLPDH